MLLLLNPLFLLLFMACKLLMSFGDANNAEIKWLSADFGIRLQIFLFLVKIRYGYDVVIIQGWRSAAEQAALHLADPRNPATPGDHGDGNAADLRFYKKGVVVLRKDMAAAKWAGVYRLAAECGIANGSLFTGYPDNNHFFIRPGSAYFRDLLTRFK